MSRAPVLLVLAGCGASVPALSKSPPPLPATITDVADVPYISGLVAPRSGDHLAWVVNHRGRRNVWLADSPDWRPRPVTGFDRDDGQVISALVFSHDGSRLAFVRGAGENGVEKHSNAASDPRGTSQEIWTVDTDGGAAVKVADGWSPALTPDGDTLAYVHEDEDDVVDVFVVAAGGGAARRAIALQGRESQLAWSPRGDRLAFNSDRGSHAFIGVYTPADELVTWMAPAGHIDDGPRWSADGARVAFLRWPPRAGESRRIRAGVWVEDDQIAVVVADATTGEGHLVEPPEPFGGFAQWGTDLPFVWSDDRIVFLSERDGWLRIYAAPAVGGEAVPIAPTGCESDIAAVSPDGATVYFTSNCDDPERRHLWKTSAGGGDAVALTRGDSLQWGAAVLDGGASIAVIDAGASAPPWPALVPAAGGAPRRLEGAPTLAAPLIEPEVVRFALPGTDVELTGQLFVPPAAAAKRQAVLYVHGGPVRQMITGWHPMEFYHQSYILVQQLAASGRVVMQLNYRLGVGYGRAFRLPEGAGPYGGAELADVFAARDFLEARDDVDQVALWGASYGGFLTGLALGTASEKFSGGVSLCGVSNWAGLGFSSLHPDDAASMAAWAPIAHVDTWTAPVLLIHGDDDRNVPFTDSLELAERLRARGKADVELVVIPDEDHFFLRDSSWQLIARRSIELYDRLLARRSPAPLAL